MFEKKVNTKEAPKQAKKEVKKEKKPGKSTSILKIVLIPLLITAAALGAAYLVLHFGDDAMEMPVVASIPAVAYCWAMCLLLLGSFRAWFDVKTPFTSYMTARSFGIYTFHYVCMSAVALLLTRTDACPAFVCYLLCFVTGLAGAILLTEIVTRIPFVRWCLLGIKKTRKKEA